jgi:DNA-binding response OmpR family regulator/anti-sigma regulatory factor (Ser/Thr protein kinase)
MAVVLVVDDEEHIRELVAHYLRRQGMATLEAENGVQALGILNAHRIDLVVLDIMMPGMDGWELCTEIRRGGSLPVLMLTAKGETMQKVRGLRLGADDYMVKPFEPEELIARVQALLRRYRIVTEQVVQVGQVSLDAKERMVTCRSLSVSLPPKEFDLLFKLMSYPGRTLSRDELIESVWGYDFDGDERTVDVHIKRLRDKFPEDLSAWRVVTVRGIEAESKRLSRLSDNLLKLTSLESGYHPYHAEPYRLDRQIRDIVLACEPTWSDKHIQVQVEAPSVEICADKDLLSQVWVNILSNAIKFTPEQGFIDISVHVSAEGVVVSITDTGMGMTEEEQERVFERFYKANTSRVTSGAGLGLSIVKKIVDLHHGTVQVVSAVNGGSTFTVSLPRAQTPLLS